jgi:hypothetical protein
VYAWNDTAGEAAAGAGAGAGVDIACGTTADAGAAGAGAKPDEGGAAEGAGAGAAAGPAIAGLAASPPAPEPGRRLAPARRLPQFWQKLNSAGVLAPHDVQTFGAALAPARTDAAGGDRSDVPHILQKFIVAGLAVVQLGHASAPTPAAGVGSAGTCAGAATLCGASGGRREPHS